MIELLTSLPLEKLGEAAIITVISICIIYLVFKGYIDHKNKELEQRLKTEQDEFRNELQSIKQEVTQIQRNTVDNNSYIDVPRDAQVEGNEVTNDSHIIVRD